MVLNNQGPNSAYSAYHFFRYSNWLWARKMECDKQSEEDHIWGWKKICWGSQGKKTVCKADLKKSH